MEESFSNKKIKNINNNNSSNISVNNSFKNENNNNKLPQYIEIEIKSDVLNTTTFKPFIIDSICEIVKKILKIEKNKKINKINCRF